MTKTLKYNSLLSITASKLPKQQMLKIDVFVTRHRIQSNLRSTNSILIDILSINRQGTNLDKYFVVIRWVKVIKQLCSQSTTQTDVALQMQVHMQVNE